MKYKNKFMMLLALNMVSSFFLEANTTKYDYLYNNITANKSKNKTNKNNYKLIEQILNQKNKELKDLYLQNDYLVKPEYLEWQVFFSGFYNHKEKKGKKAENLTAGYKNEAKSVNLGVNIPDIDLKKNIVNLDLTEKLTNIPPFTIPEIKIETPEIEKVDMNNPFPITVISFAYPEKNLLFNENNTSKIGEVVTLGSNNNYYENTSNLLFNGTNGSTTEIGKDMTLFYLENGKIDNQNEINMNFNSSNNFFNFLGIYSNDTNKYIDFENNGIFTLSGETYVNDTNLLTTIGVGFGKTVESKNPEELTPEMFMKNSKAVILSDGSESQGAYVKNFGYVDLTKYANWLYFAGKDIDYISHLPGKKVGNLIVDTGSFGIYFDTKITNNSDTRRRIDPGIVIVRGESTGIRIRGTNEKTELINLNNNSKYTGFSNTNTDKTKDSQIILESRVESNVINGGIGVQYDSSNLIEPTGSNYINIPIYITGMKNFGIYINTTDKVQNLIESDIKVLPSVIGGHSTDSQYGSTIFHSILHSGTVSAGISQRSGIVVNKGNISNMLSETLNISLNDGTILSYVGNPKGTNSTYGVYKYGGTYIQEGGSIKIGGGFSQAIYNGGGETILKNTEILATNGASGINNIGTVTSIDSHFKAEKYSVLFISSYNVNSNISGIFDFQGNNTAEIDTYGSAFLISRKDLFHNFKNLNNLELKLNKGASLFSFVNIVNPENIKLSDLPSMADMGLNIIDSEDYNSFRLYYGNFNIDKDTNLDDENNMYKKSLLFGVNSFIDSEKTITGTKNSQVAMRAYPYEVLGMLINSKIENNGTINLSGNKTFGTYTDFGTNKNNSSGEIKVTGVNGLGMYGENSSTLLNDGNITIGSNGIGIYGTSYQDPENIQTYGTGTVNVTNNGNITALDGESAVGIYINNNKPEGKTADSTLNLDGKIDVSKSENGVGLYVNKTSVNGTNSKITVGKGGVGIYAKDSNINLSNLNLNLYGDNALGIYLEGTTTFNGTGNIDIKGKGVLLYNIGPSVVFNNNLTVTASPDSSYIIGKLDGRTIVYNGTANLDSNGILFLGGNSAVLLDTTSIINGNGTNIAAIALSGQGTPDPLWNTTADGTNRGQINLSDNSMGMYGEKGTRLLNDTTGLITVGKEGAGLYTKGTDSFAINSGQINVGENSHGIYLGESTKNATNTATGKINGTASGIIGIFTHGGSAETTNEGKINLTGDKVTGIYNSGTGNTINNGKILIGDSTQKENPGIGIYGINNTINNTGEIITGLNSLGIYNSGGITNQNGSSTIGSGGTGIYTSGGTVNLGVNSVLNLGSGETTGVYGKSGSHIINNGTINTETGNIVFGLEDNSSILNNKGITLKGDSVFIYSLNGGIIENSYGADIIISGSENMGIYSKNGGSILNKGNITGDTGIANTGIYNNLGSIENYGNIKLGDSLIVDKEKPFENSYSVGIYGSENTLFKNYGNIEVGETGIGIYNKDGKTEALNKGNISSLKNGAVGIYIENSSLRNEGNITLSGNDSIGIAVGRSGLLTNTGIITMNGASNIGIYASVNSKVINNGKININGNDSIGVQLLSGSTLENNGEINIAKGLTGSKDIVSGETGYTPPSIINAGIIKVDEKFEINGLDLTIKVDPNTIRIPTLDEIMSGDYDLEDLNGRFLVSNNVSIKAPSFDLNGNTVKIDPLFTQGTNARVYKFENVFDPSTPEGGPNSGEVSVASGSLTFDAVPIINKNGGVDIWMEKINYNEFTQGTWQNEFAENIEGRYLDAKGDLLKLYDRIDLIRDKSELNKRFGELSGEVYSNMNQRETIIGDIFEDSLNLLRDSKNNTKENVKINVIAGKGKSTEETSGVLDYNYTTTGVQILREVERTYRHTFGYSLGYAHTNFEFEDGNKSKELADTIQLGLHNKYMLNSWELRNDLTGRVSLYNIDRNINWNNREKSELDGHYETYSLTSDNRLGKELRLGRQASITPYGGLKAVYMTRDKFKEKGTEGVEVKGNDAWSVKPRAGVELKGNLPLGSNTGWQLKSSLDIAYEYELVDLEKEERAKLGLLEDNYHKLAKPEEDKGKLRTKATVGVEVEDRYGIFLTGEYSIGNHNENDYRVGLNLKAVF